ncbi:MAG: hypothetical protein V1694_08580 [Candidatus Eisenbacteria bacterium]
MKKLLLALAMICLFATSGWALTATYGWEDCGTVLGRFPVADPSVICTNVVASALPDYVHSGLRSLRLERIATVTTQAYVAWIKGLTTGDIVTVRIWVYDVTTSNPSGRLWAHYANSTDPASYGGSASGPGEYSGSTGWVQMLAAGPASWTFGTPAPTDPLADAIMIEFRNYGNIPTNILWVDDIEVTAPTRPGVSIVFPSPGPSATEPSTWGGIKALFR